MIGQVRYGQAWSDQVMSCFVKRGQVRTGKVPVLSGHFKSGQVWSGRCQHGPDINRGVLFGAKSEQVRSGLVKVKTGHVRSGKDKFQSVHIKSG